MFVPCVRPGSLEPPDPVIEPSIIEGFRSIDIPISRSAREVSERAAESIDWERIRDPPENDRSVLNRWFAVRWVSDVLGRRCDVPGIGGGARRNTEGRRSGESLSTS